MSFDTKNMEYIRKLFPEIDLIKQTELQIKVASAWIEAWKRSKYHTIEEGIFTVATPQNRLVDHIRAVTKTAIAIADVLKEIHHFEVNRDYLIAGSLLHDVDKLIVFEKAGDKYVRAEISRKLSHGFIGASIAERMDLPEDIVHMILSHTTRAPVHPCTLEAVILRYADYADADAMFFASHLKLLLEQFQFNEGK